MKNLKCTQNNFFSLGFVFLILLNKIKEKKNVILVFGLNICFPVMKNVICFYCLAYYYFIESSSFSLK